MSAPDTPSSPAAQTPLWLYGLLLLLGGMWGLSFSAAKISTSLGGHPAGLGMWQSLGGGLIQLTILLARRRRPRLSRQHLLYYLGTGALGIAIPSVMIFSAAPHLPAGVMSMIITTAPLATYLVALGAGMERYSLKRLGGIALGFVGVAVLLLPQATANATDGTGGAGIPIRWALTLMVAPICYAFMAVLSARHRPQGTDNLSLACGMLLGAASLQGAYAILTGNVYSILPPWNVTHASLTTMALIAGLAQFLFFLVVEKAGPVFLSQVGYLITIAGIFWGMALFGESLSPTLWISLALLLGGITLVRPTKRESEAEAVPAASLED